MRFRPIAKRLLCGGLGVFIVIWYLRPVPELSALSSVEADRTGQPSSASREEQFACDRTSDEVTFRWSVCLSRGDLTVELLDEGGQRLEWLKLTGNDSGCWTDHLGHTLAQGQMCRLLCVEREVVGRYRISASLGRPGARWDRYWMFPAAAVAAFALTGLLSLAGVGGSRLRAWLPISGLLAFLSSWGIILALAHEGGHLLALAMFGAWDPAATDLLGLSGEPHVGVRPSAQLAAWQTAAMSISGPMLPTLLGYGLLGLTAFRPRWREQNGWGRFALPLLAAVLLFPQTAVTLIWLAGGTDTDYSRFIENAGLPTWVSGSALAVVGLVNFAMVIWIVKYLGRRFRAKQTETG